MILAITILIAGFISIVFINLTFSDKTHTVYRILCGYGILIAAACLVYDRCNSEGCFGDASFLIQGEAYKIRRVVSLGDGTTVIILSSNGDKTFPIRIWNASSANISIEGKTCKFVGKNLGIYGFVPAY